MIDTQDKRRSVGPLYGWYTVQPVADGTVDVQDRPQARWIYSGLTYGEFVAPTVFPWYLVKRRRRMS